MAFHEYPYTDFHEMNLDWILQTVKQLTEDWAQVRSDWEDEQAAFADLQSYIENYFNNLDVQQEINVKLDGLVLDGTMSELIAPYVASGLPAEVASQLGDVVAAQIGAVVAAQIGAVVADQLPAIAASAAATEVGTWLSTHIDPDTGYVIDDSLTVQGAAADAKAVGDEVTAIKSALTEIVDYQPILKTADKESDVFETSSQYGYLHLSDGHFISDINYTILTFDITDETMIALSNSGPNLVGAVLYSEHLNTIPDSGSSARDYFVKSCRSDKTGENAMPTVESPWNVENGQMLAIFFDHRNQETNFTLTYDDGKIIKLDNNVKFNDAQIDEIKQITQVSVPSIKYGAVDTDIGSRGKEQITIYLPTYGGFIKYAFVRCEYDAYNCNIWRIDMCYACDANKEVLFPITNRGEWEFAILINGAPDFIGGNAHGDEVFTDFTVLIDGKKIDNITTLTEQNFECVRIIEKSLLYDPSDGATLSTRSEFEPIGKHGKEYIITADGIRLTQTLELDKSLDLDTSYMTMLPLMRGNDSYYAEQITDHYFGNDAYTIYDISDYASGDGYGWRRNITRATVWGEDSGVCATVEMLKQPNINNAGSRLFKVQDSDKYNKLYWSICGVGDNIYEASVGEHFFTDTLYKIDFKSSNVN